MINLLLDTIKLALKDTHIESGRTDEFESTCHNLEQAISDQIAGHYIDYYTEQEKRRNSK